MTRAISTGRPCHPDRRRFRAFDGWRDLIGYLELKVVLDSDAMLYGVGGRTAIGAADRQPGNAGKRFDQGAGAASCPFPDARDRDAVDRSYAFLKDRSDIVRPRPRRRSRGRRAIRSSSKTPTASASNSTTSPASACSKWAAQIGGAEIFDCAVDEREARQRIDGLDPAGGWVSMSAE